jgi:hypothetical protein
MLFVLTIVKLATVNLDGCLLGALGGQDIKFGIFVAIVIL